MTITNIEKTKKGRYSLFIDDEFVFSVHRDTLHKCHISSGKVTTTQELEHIMSTDGLISAKEQALNILSRAPQSTGNLAEKLEKYYPEDIVAQTVARMTELGLLDDTDYAMRFSRDCINLKKYSLRRTKEALMQKKIPPHIIEHALEQFDDDQVDAIVDIVLKKYRSKIFEYDSLQKVIAALMRKGYPYHDIKAALDKIEAEELYL